jgi:hypothetical protein
MAVGFEVDVKRAIRGLTDVQRKQVPFASSLMLTSLAGRVGQSWQADMLEVLDRPTPFTMKSVMVIPARKTHLVATVRIRDIAAQYLEPFVDGGPHFLGGKRGLLKPKNVPLNAYGNLSKNKLATLKAKGNVFVGPLALRSGQRVNGVWQRVAPSAKAKGGALKLLIRFADTQPVTQRLDFYTRAGATIRQWAARDWASAWAKARATAR